MDSHLRTAVASGMGAVIGGEPMEPAHALAALAEEPHLICHSVYLIERLGVAAQAPRAAVRAAREQRHLDVAELFAFVCPARFATPTPVGFARSLALEPGADDGETVRLIAEDLLNRLSNKHYPLLRETAENAGFLARAKWPWAEPAMRALLTANPRMDAGSFATGLNAWDRIEEWEEDGSRAPGRQDAIAPEEAQRFLREVLGADSEQRGSQAAYAGAATFAFQPRQSKEINNILLAEAGTGLGKTLGYLAPAYLWARKNDAPVWVSTYTKNLQRQLDQETSRLIENPEERSARIVIRKGRENYVCLLNMQEVFGRLTSANPRTALLAALISRWARFTRDGDMAGGDFPSWILSLFNDLSLDGEQRGVTAQSLGLTDRRGECIYSACPHYRRCFIERSVRAGRNASIVIANHALVLHQAAIDHALGVALTGEEAAAPGGIRRIVFDEGHHLFDAADSAFSGHLTALETAELRRWIRGPEAERRRGRGLADRIGDLLGEDERGRTLLQQVLRAALALPGPGWTRRVQAGQPEGLAENFLSLVRQQVLARAEQNAGSGHTIETDCLPLADGLAAAAAALMGALLDLKKPMSGLANALAKKLDDEAKDLTTHDRGRIEAVSRSLKRRGELMVGAWADMLKRLLEEKNPLFVEWFDIAQAFGREHDVGLHSHWLDPTEPMALAVLRQADGIVITSATLKDRPPDVPDDWANAEMRTGAVHLPYPVKRKSWESPFDYPDASRVIVVTDVNREDMDQVAAAYRELFLAAGGGGLGLFTAISRLRAVHMRLVKPLADAGLPLYAQHVDPMDTGTLVDMFRAERDACLLGTDAVRDGVDVPGDSLRLIALDRVPWGTPTILERARKEAFGGNAYTDMVVRLRLRQAFGRLIRRAGDRGHFVVLDPRLASRFLTAFPPGVAVSRLGLADAIDAVRGRLDNLRSRT
ncbi:ATP-dependent DNA helicase [Aestuariivirga sp.]|uniref:ATP-dependent DNA helicase n=1 Tax=Aestuariivirga sp. TaxID=2650926 RepID=UPI0025BC521A|nr:ATP-dependent DNA helicase [Aestuariivirga sp.]MCA3554663.1 ATP-dependent DNA helicase [Aestuariivirga sp.]